MLLQQLSELLLEVLGVLLHFLVELVRVLLNHFLELRWDESEDLGLTPSVAKQNQ